MTLFTLVDGRGEIVIDLVGQERFQGAPLTRREGLDDHLERAARAGKELRFLEIRIGQFDLRKAWNAIAVAGHIELRLRCAGLGAWGDLLPGLVTVGKMDHLVFAGRISLGVKGIELRALLMPGPLAQHAAKLKDQKSCNGEQNDYIDKWNVAHMAMLPVLADIVKKITPLIEVK
jgi:hypothetical protein